MRTRNTGRPIKLYEGYLNKRTKVEGALREAGIDDAALTGWRADIAGGDRQIEVSLREAHSFNYAGDLTDEHETLIQEAGSTSDFGTYLADKATKRLMASYQEEPANWRQYAQVYNVPDFKPVSFVRLTEMEDLLPLTEGGPVLDSRLGEIAGPDVTVADFARLFSLPRKAIINDDLNQLRDRPAAMGRAYVRTLNKSVVANLVGNGNAYDGTPTFSVAHGNLISGLLSEAVVGQMITKLRVQRDDNGNRIGLAPFALIVPPELELVADRIVASTVVPLAGYAPGSTAATAAAHGYGDRNVIGSRLRRVISETYLEDPDDAYVIADPNLAPTVGVGFLNGVQTPDVFLHDPGMRNVLGTSDPYSMVYQQITYMVRGTWGNALLDWRGGVKTVN